jgi:hypothetical protein
LGAGPLDLVFPRLPRPPRYGLVPLAPLIEVATPDDRWANGVTWLPEHCVGGEVFDPCGPAAGEGQEEREVLEFVAFTVEATIECSTLGGATLFQEYLDRVEAKLLGVESARIEEEFWDGAVATAAGWPNKFLTDGDVTLPEGASALGFVTALAVLEQAIADGTDWGEGMIHAKPFTVSIWASEGLVHRDGNVLRTTLGTVVVPGRGYPGTGPSGQAHSADRAWAYATELVELRRSAITFSGSDVEAVVPETNERTVRASRNVAVTWDGCVQAGVLVDHTDDITVTGS